MRQLSALRNGLSGDRCIWHAPTVSVLLVALYSHLCGCFFYFYPKILGGRDLQMMDLFENECSLSGGYNQKIKKNHTFLKMTLRSIVYSKTSLKYFLCFDRLTSFKIMYNNLPVFLAIAGTERPGWLVLVLVLVASRRCPRR